MVKQFTPVRVISFVLLAACGALCQKPPPADRFQETQFDGSKPPEVHRQEMLAAGSLPDAPSAVQPPTYVQRYFTFASAAASLPRPGVLGLGVRHETQLGHFNPGPQRNLTALYQVALVQKDPGAFLNTYLYPPLERNARYHASTSDSFMGRASDAASRIFVTHDDSGKAKLNTRYFIGVLSSVAMHAAYRPYRTRSTSETFNNFGSTIGGDAGINIFHEFRPGIGQMLKGLTPKFASRIADRITQNQIPK